MSRDDSQKLPSIGIIVQWFGPLPEDFSIWKRSAEYNESIDFIFVTDQDVGKLASNMRLVKTSLLEESRRYGELLGFDISFPTAYKACDARAFYGILYSDLLKEYDFWGYCDIDLVFGDIRGFLTPKVLSTYDRFYDYGHLNIYRNTNEVNHWYEMPGSAYTLEEVFEYPVKTTFEEHWGINRICELNGLRWYRDVDYADISPRYNSVMLGGHELPNYDQQVWYWENGRARRAFLSGKNVCNEDYVYIHHQKRRLALPFLPSPNDIGYYLLPSSYLLKEHEGIPTPEELRRMSTSISSVERMHADLKYYMHKTGQLLTADAETKRIWIRQLILRAGGGHPR